MKRVLQKCRILFDKCSSVTTQPIKEFCSCALSTILRLGKGANNILIIFCSFPTAVCVLPIVFGNLSLYFSNIEKKDIETIELNLITCLSIFIPLVIGQVLNEISKLKEEYTEAITTYSTTVKSFVNCTYLIIVLFCMAICTILGRRYFDTNLPQSLSFLVVHIISFSLIMNLGLVFRLIYATGDYFSEMIEGLSKESNKQQLRKYFSRLCSKGNDRWISELKGVALSRKEDLFLMIKNGESIADSEEYKITAPSS